MRRVVLFAACLMVVAVGTFAQVKNEKTLTRKLGGLKEKAESLRRQIRANNSEKSQVRSDMQWVDGQISQLDDRLDASRDRLDSAKETQRGLAKDLAVESAQLDQVKGEAARRLRSMAMTGSETVLSVLVGSKSVADFAARKALVERVAAHDKILFESVRTLRDKVLVKKQAQDATVAKIARITSSIQQDKEMMRQAMKKKRQILAKLNSKAESLGDQLDEMEDESRAIEAKLRAYQSSPGSSKVYTGGRFLKPASGRVTSGFGMRYHPILHKSRLHAGIDFGASSGSPVLAAAAGTVVSAGWRGGYGNCIVIDHGGGISTLYGHMSRLFAHDGEKVSRGQKIGAVGSTGLATGPHLHWEVRVNGSPVNPAGRY